MTTAQCSLLSFLFLAISDFVYSFPIVASIRSFCLSIDSLSFLSGSIENGHQTVVHWWDESIINNYLVLKEAIWCPQPPAQWNSRIRVNEQSLAFALLIDNEVTLSDNCKMCSQNVELKKAKSITENEAIFLIRNVNANAEPNMAESIICRNELRARK